MLNYLTSIFSLLFFKISISFLLFKEDLLMKARAVFDTLAYANRLKTAGLDPKIAETQAEANADMIANLLDNALLTKQDLLQSESGLKFQIKEVESRLEAQINEVESKLEARINEVELKLEKKILQTESRLQQQIKDLETRLTIRLGGMIAGSIGITLSILHVLH